MKQRLGIILIISGMILLMKPEFEAYSLLDIINDSLIRYWPIGLILMGIHLINKKQSRSKRKT